jgi:RNA polymerase sigma-70 factor (ECF subfamily)
VSAARSWPAEHPSVDTIAMEIPRLRTQLHRAGVPAQDMEDILQEILTGTIVAIREDRYQPDPHGEPRKALRRWLAGVAFRQIGHYRTCAYRRREIPRGTPERASDATPPPSAEGLDVLRALTKLPPELREVIKLEALGWRVTEIAVSLAISYSVASRRVRIARERIARLARRKGW